MDIIKTSGIIICALCVLMVFKNIKNEYSLFIRLVITISVSIFSLAVIYPILSYIEEISRGTSLFTYIPTLIKALGIALSMQITGDICKDAGENAIAERVALFGRAEILILTIPMIKELFDLCGRII